MELPLAKDAARITQNQENGRHIESPRKQYTQQAAKEENYIPTVGKTLSGAISRHSHILLLRANRSTA